MFFYLFMFFIVMYFTRRQFKALHFVYFATGSRLKSLLKTSSLVSFATFFYCVVQCSLSPSCSKSTAICPRIKLQTRW